MEIINRELVQSYIMTTAKYDFSVHEKRILYRIVETLQRHLEGVKLSHGVTLDLGLLEDATLRMPIANFLNGEKDQNYSRVISALRNLRKKDVDIHYKNGDLTIVGMIGKATIEPRSGYAEFTVHKEVVDALLDFAKGHRVYELKTAFEFESNFSMRFYELFSKQKKPIRYSIDYLKGMFGVSDKYIDRPGDFVRKVINVAKKELDKNSPYSFNYEIEKESRKIKNILFTPVYLPDNEDKGLKKKRQKKKVSVHWELSKPVIEALRDKFEFTDDEIKRNLATLSKAENELDDFLAFISKKHGGSRAETIREPKGWFIAAVKKELEQGKSL
jgi:plasmid replication initiation protein